MSELLILAVPVIVLALVALAGFAGCAEILGIKEPFVTVTNSERVLEKNPVAFWRFEETDTSRPAEDATGHGYNGTYHAPASIEAQAGATFNFGKERERALRLEGGYVEVPWTSALNPMKPTGAMGGFSVEAWVKLTGDEPAKKESQLIVFSFDLSNFSELKGYSLQVAREQGKTPQLSATVYAKKGNHTPATDLPKGDWHYIVMSYGSDGLRLYVDGQEKAHEPSAAYTPNAQAALWIGAARNPNGNVNGALQGYIDNVAIYGSPLDQATITDHGNPMGVSRS